MVPVTGYQNRYADDFYDDEDGYEPEDSPDVTASATSTEGDGTEGDATPDLALQTVGRAATPTGSIEVRTTEQGLPTAIRIERSEMDRPADALARTILLLCQQAGKRAAAAHRTELLAQGHPIEAVSYLNLPTDREAADFDLYVDSQLGDSEPDTWMRRV